MLKKLISLSLSVCILICLSSCTTIENNNNFDTINQTQTTTATQSNTENTTEPVKNDDSADNVDSNKTESSQTQASTTKPQVPATQSQVVTTRPQVNTQSSQTHNHSYSNATCTSPKKCSCGATAGTALGHQFSSATCTSPKICNRCGATNGSALGHSYSSAACVLPKTCTRCGNTQGSALGHSYVNNKCSRCGKIDPDSLPVALNTLHVIDSKYYNYRNGSFTDSFGNTYFGAHAYSYSYECMNGKEPHSTFSLNGKYNVFRGSIVATTAPAADATYYIKIYVDDMLVFSETGYSKTSGKKDFEINTKNGQTLKIAMGIEQRYKGQYTDEIAIVNAELEK